VDQIGGATANKGGANMVMLFFVEVREAVSVEYACCKAKQKAKQAI
jgi:hypothetical protein